VNLSFSKTKIQISDVTLYLSGNMIVGQSNGAFPQEYLYPTPIPIPDEFLQQIPQT